MIVPFVDIGGIVENDCLDFLFLILILITSHMFWCFIIYNFGINACPNLGIRKYSGCLVHQFLFVLVRKDMDVKEHEKLSKITPFLTQINIKEGSIHLPKNTQEYHKIQII